MSFLNKVFRKKTTSSSTLPEAILKLKETEDLLLKKQNVLESKIKKEVQTARQNAAKNKKAALHALQRKKCYERQLQRIDGVLTTIEAQREALEGANVNVAAVDSMKKASDALKSAHKFMNADQVDNLLSDLADQKDIAEEITDAICHPVGFEDAILDENELERELQALELEDSALKDLNDGDKLKEAEQDLPSVAETEKPKIAKKKEKPEAVLAT